MASMALIHKLDDATGLSPTLLRTASILTFERLVFRRALYLVSSVDPVCLNFLDILFTVDEKKSNFRPYIVQNFQTVIP